MGCCSSHHSSRIVETKYGTVQGTRIINDGELRVDAFLGIPFAAPPVGQLRFRKPVPPESWTGVRQCTKFARRCVQRDYFMHDKIRKRAGSEDCLYLNLFTPVWQPPHEGFPVMVFVHGGGFSMHDAETYGDEGIARFLVQKGVIVVTIQYRLGYLGFFSTGDDACRGNWGLWDQTAALQWVQDNVEAFNGNKNNVTLFGQSAGGASVDLLSLSPHSRDLFHKVCPMAGVATAPWTLHPDLPEKCREKARKLGVEEKNSEALMAKLREMKPSCFASGVEPEQGIDKAIMDNTLDITPIVDGDFLPTHPSLLRKSAPAKPIMTGVAKLEAVIFLMKYKVTLERLQEMVGRSLPSSLPGQEKIRDDLVESYLDTGKLSPNHLMLRSFAEAYGDRSMHVPTLRMVTESLKNHPEAPAYSYVFEYSNRNAYGLLSFLMPIKDATHCTELNYLFGKGILWPYKFTSNDNHMLHLFTTAFTNFAKYGNPNGGSIEAARAPPLSPNTLPVFWPAATLENPETHYVFDLTPRVSTTFMYGRPRRIAQYQEQYPEERL
ncbi:hypothetical protein PFISCL1PPCAC_9381 [Pristionchus fissidentatus]|uniref:Carboxylesterase type B domain-containing protein n=1 Tax=Pristionchus fissidentatus TaxID=1538716 RepID=A0AAV5VJX4_9BILA|nr:hypothetical protein PFISCL1PPCAC_9381 [Pristionchus fissidentatus]